MGNKEQSAVAKRVRQWSSAASRRFGLATMLMSLTMLFGSVAHAEPTLASQYLQLTKNNFAVAKINYQIGRNYATASNAAVARSYFIAARSNSIQMYTHSLNLQQQNLDTLARGQYRNAAYQQMAVSYSRLLSSQVSLLDAYLSILTQTPLSQNARVNVDAMIIQITSTLLQTEQAMVLAQR
jgi:hypothetical protein